MYQERSLFTRPIRYGLLHFLKRDGRTIVPQYAKQSFNTPHRHNTHSTANDYIAHFVSSAQSGLRTAGKYTIFQPHIILDAVCLGSALRSQSRNSQNLDRMHLGLCIFVAQDSVAVHAGKSGNRIYGFRGDSFSDFKQSLRFLYLHAVALLKNA